MRLVGKDKEPLDLSRQEHKDALDASMRKWSQARAEDAEGALYGYVDVEGLQLPPFGAPYAAAPVS